MIRVAAAGTLTAVTPSGATPGITIQISGTGFNPVAGENQVTFVPASGSAQTLPATSVTILDPATGRGRALVKVPAGLPAGPVGLRVTNGATGETSEGRTLQVLAIALGAVRSARADGSSVEIEITGSGNTAFVPGATRVVLGAGITVESVTVDSATRLRASIAVARSAAPGPRTLAFNTSQQMGTLPDAFTVLAPPANSPPVADANGPYSGQAGGDVAFSSAGSSDPDGDPISFEWTFGDGSSSAAPNPAHRYGAPGVYDVVLTVRDNQGNATSATTKATIDATTNQPPVADAGGPYAGQTAAPVAFSGLGSADPDGDVLIFAWSFGDGSTGIGPSPDHAYAQPGIYTVTLLVSDGRGGTDTAQTIARVSTPAPGNQPPRAVIGGPYTVTVGEPLTLSAAGSSDPDNDALAYAWAFGDGEAGTGVSTVHTYAAVGAYTATVLVSDGRGGSDTAQAEVVVTPAPAPQNQPPVARAGDDVATRAGVVVRFDGSASSDPDNDPLTLAWSFGDGESAAGPTPGHAYAEPGVYTATLLVTDGRGGAAIDTLTVTVTVDQSNRPPTASISGPAAGETGQSLTFSAVASDPDNDPLTFAWDFEDGTGDGVSVAHAWPQAGKYTVRLTVADGRGGIATATQQVTVTNPPTPNNPPVADAGGPYQGQENQPIAFDGSLSSDPDNDPLNYAWSFGDGSAGAGVSPSHAYARAGTYTVTLVVSDPSGASSSATTQAVVTGTTPVNRAPSARPGGPYSTSTGIGVPFDGSGSTDPDGDPLTYSWDFGDQAAKGSGPSPVHPYLEPGVFTVTLTVTDPSGASDSATTTVSISAPADRSPPNVTLSAPKLVLPGAQVTATARAVDNVAVSSVRFEVENDTPSDTATEPFQRTFSVPALATPGQTILVRAIARDPSDNTGQAETTVTVTVLPDTEPPVVALSGPPQTTAGASMRLVATATDNVGVASVTFFAGADPIGMVQTPPYEVVHTVPSGVSVGAQLPFTARAVDFSGNTGEGSATVPVVGTPDETPPQVALTAPPQVSVGAPLKLSAVATDDVGVASVTFFVNGVPVATDTQAPYTAEAAFPAGTNPGGVIAVTATAVDFANLSASDGRSVLVIAPPAISRGVIAGEVYDDTTGLPVAGATVALTGRDLQGKAYDQQATTDGRGRYLLRGNEGNAVVIVTKAGWTRVDRPVQVLPGRAIAPFDARLTPLATAVNLSPITGGQAGTDAARIEVPVAALQGPASIAVTPISQQGLQGLLPAGWTPVGAADVTPHGLAFTGTASLRLANRFALPQGTVLTIAAWDEPGAAWRVVSTTTIGADGALAGEVPGTGQFAWLLADGQPLTPPSGVGGAPLAGVELPVVPDPVDTVVTPQPKVLFYQPGVHSDVRTTITAPAPLSSGARLWARISETYSYYSGGQANPDPYVQDLVFYQVPSTPAVLAADYPVGPSLAFESLSLEQGVIGVDAYVPATGDSGAQLLSSDGGVVAGPGGESLVLPPGAVADATPFDLATLAADALGLTLPTELAFAGGVEVRFTGALGAAAALAVPKPPGYTNADAARTLLVRLQELGGQTRLVLVGLARINGDALASDLSIGGQATPLEGVRVAGRYVFVRLADAIGPIGFAEGHVAAIGGGPFSGALVSGGLPVVSLSRADGAYFAVGRAGPTTFTATDLAKFDEGTGTTTVLAARAVPLDITLAPQPPRVTSLVPANDAVAVPLSDALVAIFSEPIDPATATPDHVRLVPSGGDPVAGSIALSSNNTKLTFRAAAPLAPATTFAFTLTQGLRDLSGYGLDKTYATTFTSLDTNPPPQPPAGSLNATIPDDKGESVVTGTQGTAGVHDRVFILNATTGSSTPALVEPNGSFRTVVQAGLKDKLRIQIVGPGGSETLADLGLFRNPDGSVVVPPEGGTIDGPNGSQLEVQPGTFPNAAIVLITAVAPDAIVARTTPDFPLVAAFDISASAQPLKYMRISVPAPEGRAEGEPGVVARVEVVGGEERLVMVDTARIVGGRLKTESPPCPGLLDKFARYALYLNDNAAMRQFGYALLETSVVRQRTFTFPGLTMEIFVGPVLGGPIPVTVTPPITFDFPYYPASPFIAHIRKAEEERLDPGIDPVLEALFAADQVCLLAPADRKTQVVIREAQTRRPLNTVPWTAPSSGTSAPLQAAYVDPSDIEPPEVIWASWSPSAPQVLDLGEPVTLLFSEPIKVAATPTEPYPVYLYERGTGATIRGTHQMLHDGRGLAFVPERPLPMGRTYEVRLPGVRDLAGNAFRTPAAGHFTFTSFQAVVITPSSTFGFARSDLFADLASAAVPFNTGGILTTALKDVDFVTKRPDETTTGAWQTTIFGIGSNQMYGFQLLAVDASQPYRPRAVGAVGGGARSYTRLKVLDDVHFQPRLSPWIPSPAAEAWRARLQRYAVDDPTVRVCVNPADTAAIAAFEQRSAQPGRTFATRFGCGDLAGYGSYNNAYSIVHFYDVTDPTRPANLGQRLLGDNGAEQGFPRRKEAPAGLGVPLGIDLVPGLQIAHENGAPSPNTVGAFVANLGIGTELADVARNSPVIELPERPGGGSDPSRWVYENLGVYTFPFHRDVKALGSQLVVIAGDPRDGSGTAHIELFDFGLSTPAGPFPLPFRPNHLAVAPSAFVSDANGDGVPEYHDIAVVTGFERDVAVVEVKPGQVDALGFVQMPTTSGTGRYEVKQLRGAQIDTGRQLVFVAARWERDGVGTWGIVVVDLARAIGPSVDADADQVDDRILGFTPVVPVTRGEMLGFRYDPQRRLIYVALDTNPKDGTETNLAIVRTCDCPDSEARVTLESSTFRTNAGVSKTFRSTDGFTSQVFVNLDARYAQDVLVDFETEISAGRTLTWRVTEEPLSRDPADALFDLSVPSLQTGTFDPSVPRVRLVLNARATPTSGSRVYVDFLDERGVLVSRNLLQVHPAFIQSESAPVRTHIDRINEEVYETAGSIVFALPWDAKVTIRVDGLVITPGGAPLQDVFYPAGVHRVTVTRADVITPGEHTYRIDGQLLDDPVVTASATGTVQHEVDINESLPIGHTFIDGVDLATGAFTLSREDVNLPTRGPRLAFSRTYSSSGVRSQGVMGAGWTHSLDASLQVGPSGAVTVVGGEGSSTRFSQPTSGVDASGRPIKTYKPQVGYHGSLVYLASDNAFDFYPKSRLRHRFEPLPGPDGQYDFRLAYIEDPFGNRLTLQYGASSPHLLERVRDSAGRELALTYAPYGLLPEPRLTKIEGPLGLVVEYGYDQYGNLVSARRASSLERYDYTVTQVMDRHNLVRIIGPNHGLTGADHDQTAIEWAGVATPSPADPPYIGPSGLLQRMPPAFEMVKAITAGADTPDASRKAFAYDFGTGATPTIETTVTDGRDIDTKYVQGPRGNLREKRVQMGGGREIVTASTWALDLVPPVKDVQIVEQTDANGRTTKYEYDANGNLTRETIVASVAGYAGVTNRAGNAVTNVVTESRYDLTFNAVVERKDPEGNVTTWALDPATGSVLAETTDPQDGSGLTYTSSYTYNPDGTIQTVTDRRGKITRYLEYNNLGQATRVQDAEGNVATSTFDARGRLLEASDSFGRRTTYAYDDLDRPRSITKFAGAQPADARLETPDRVATHEYYPSGQLKREVDGAGHETVYLYDAQNRVSGQKDTVNDADGAPVLYETSYVYDGNGNRVEETNRRGVTRRFAYDGLNRLVGVDVLGGAPERVMTLTYDSTANRLSEQDMHGHTTRFEYDALYRPVATVHPVSPWKETFAYDLMGNVTRQTDANGHPTVTTYDGLSRIRVRTDPLGTSISYTYDGNGNVLTETSSNGLVAEYGYDALNRQVSMIQRFTDPVSGQAVSYPRSIDFDDSTNSKTVTGPRGIRTLERKNGRDLLIERVVDVGGLELRTQLGYDGMDRLTRMKDAEGSEIDQETIYDGLGRKIRVLAPLGGEERLYYDGSDNIVRHVDRRSIERKFVFDRLERRTAEILVESISNGGTELTVSSIDFDDATGGMVTKDPNGNETTTAVDAMHRVTATTDALDHTTTQQWDGANVRVEIDQRNLRTESDYDALNRLTAKRSFDASGRVAETATSVFSDTQNRRVDTNPRGIAMVVQMDPLGRLRTRVAQHADLVPFYGAASVPLEEIRYDGAGNPVETVDANGNVTARVYDGADRMTTMTQASGTPVAATTTYTYDGSGQILTVKDARAHGGPFDMRYTYDARRRTVSEENGAGEVRTFTHTQADQIETLTEPKGAAFTTRFEYDEVGKILSVDETRGGAGGVTRYRYDASRNLLAEQDPAGGLTTYAYDALNRLSVALRHVVPGAIGATVARGGGFGGDDATARRWSHGYDDAGNETLLVDPAGQRVVKEYDHQDRLARATYQNHAPLDPDTPKLVSIEYARDANGNLTLARETKQVGAVTRVEEHANQYDPLDRAVATTSPDGKTVAQRFDRAGNLVLMRDADGVETAYEYDARRRMVRLRAPDGVGTEATSYGYAADGLLTKTAYPNGVVTEYDYDAADRFSAVLSHRGSRNAPITSFEYDYDANGNRVAQRDRREGVDGGAVRTTAYAYDALNRLTSVAYPVGRTVAYGYAANGNRLTEKGADPATGAPVDRRFAYNALNELTRVEDLVTPAASTVFRYDANGNERERSVGTIDPSGAQPSPTLVRRFSFDIRDEMVGADTLDGQRARFEYDFARRRTRFTSPQIDLRYLYEPRGVLLEYDASAGATTSRYTYAIGQLHSMLSRTPAGRQPYYYLFDGLFSTSDLTDRGGAVAASYDYDAWGGLLRKVDLTPNRRLFTGQISDPETGFYYFNARFYDPTIGRFLSADTYAGSPGSPASRHRYGYAHNNPTGYVDPTGHYIESALDVLSLGIGVYSFQDNIRKGDYAGAALDGLGIAIDAVALALPFIPGGASLGIKAIRNIDRIDTYWDILKFGEKGLNTFQAGAESYLQYQDGNYGMAALNGLFAGVGLRGMKKSGGDLLSGMAKESRLSVSAPPDFKPNVREHFGKKVLASWDYERIVRDERAEMLAKKKFASSLVHDAEALTIMDLIEESSKRGLHVVEHGIPGYGGLGKVVKSFSNLEIGIRASDPFTAARSRGLAAMGKFEAKPLDNKAKTNFGFDMANNQRTDYDIAWIVDRTDPAQPRFLTNDEVLMVADILNEQAKAMKLTASFKHAAHFSAPDLVKVMQEGASGRTVKDAMGKVVYEEGSKMTWAKYQAMSDPGAVEVFKKGYVREMLTPGQVYEYAVKNNLFYPPTWNMSFAPKGREKLGAEWQKLMAPMERIIGGGK